MIKPPKNIRDFSALVEVVKALRDPNDGCPWDIQQTHKSLTPHMIEEAHELVEAIESNSQEGMQEELGDVFLQVVLHSEIARQSQTFDILDVIEALNKKLISRHSHVFSTVEAETAQEALANWDAMKAKEKEGKPQKDHFEVPVSLPALQRAQKIGAKTKKQNFDWEKIEDVWHKVKEEETELAEALQSGNKNAIEEELGDLLFSLAQLARHADLEAETVLRKANQKFERRFFKMKGLAESRGLKLDSLTSDKLENLWHEAKKL